MFAFRQKIFPSPLWTDPTLFSLILLLQSSFLEHFIGRVARWTSLSCRHGKPARLSWLSLALFPSCGFPEEEESKLRFRFLPSFFWTTNYGRVSLTNSLIDSLGPNSTTRLLWRSKGGKSLTESNKRTLSSRNGILSPNFENLNREFHLHLSSNCTLFINLMPRLKVLYLILEMKLLEIAQESEEKRITIYQMRETAFSNETGRLREILILTNRITHKLLLQNNQSYELNWFYLLAWGICIRKVRGVKSNVSHNYKGSAGIIFEVIKNNARCVK